MVEMECDYSEYAYLAGQKRYPSAARFNKSKGKLSDIQMFCDDVLKELFGIKHRGYGWPFYTLVDAKHMGLQDYFQKIVHPMDLTMVKNKLDNRSYGSVAEFAADVRLVFDNCYTYTEPNHDIHIMGRKLQQVFETHMAAMPHLYQ